MLREELRKPKVNFKDLHKPEVKAKAELVNAWLSV